MSLLNVVRDSLADWLHRELKTRSGENAETMDGDDDASVGRKNAASHATVANFPVPGSAPL